MKDTKANDISRKEIRGERKPEEFQTACHGTNGYEIRVRDHLETYWHTWFEGWSVTNLENGEVLLKSVSMDQSGLHGALNKIRDLNLTLLEVKCLPTDENSIGKTNKRKE